MSVSREGRYTFNNSIDTERHTNWAKACRYLESSRLSYCARRRLAKHYFSDAWTQARAQRWRARLKRSRAQGCSGAARDGVQARARWSECWDVLRWQWSYWQKSRRARTLSLSQSVSGSSSGNRRQRQGGCCWWAARRSSRGRASPGVSNCCCGRLEHDGGGLER